MIIVTNSRRVINFDNIIDIRIGKIEDNILLSTATDTPELEMEYRNRFHELQSQGYIRVVTDNPGFDKMFKETSTLELVSVGYTITLKEGSNKECLDGMQTIINDYKNDEKICLIR